MKRLSRPAASIRRKGTLFHYYMMYLFLSSVLMTTAGLCLHSILKADRVDTKVAEYLTALERLNLAFRNDASSSPASIEAAGIRFDTDNGAAIRWTVRENLLKRESIRAEQTETTERFLFPRDTSIEFMQDKEFVICRITEPSAMPAGYGDAPSQAKTVEILASVRISTPAADRNVERAGKDAEKINKVVQPEPGSDDANVETSDGELDTLKEGDQ